MSFKKYILGFIYLIISFQLAYGQDTIVRLTIEDLGENKEILLAEKEGWIFKKGNDLNWASPNLDISEWMSLNPTDISISMADESGKLEGWFRFKFMLDSSFTQKNLFITQGVWAATDIFIDGKKLHSFGNTGSNGQPFKSHNYFQIEPIDFNLEKGVEHLLAIHFVDVANPISNTFRSGGDESNSLLFRFINLSTTASLQKEYQDFLEYTNTWATIASITFLITLICWLLYFQNHREKHLLLIAIAVTCTFFSGFAIYFVSLGQFGQNPFNFAQILMAIPLIFIAIFLVVLPILIVVLLKKKIPILHWLVIIIQTSIIFFIYFVNNSIFLLAPILSILLCGYYIIAFYKNFKKLDWIIIAGLIATIILFLFTRYTHPIIFISLFLAFPVSFLIYLTIWLRDSNREMVSNAQQLVKINKEKQEILANQNSLLENQVEDRTAELNNSLNHLKSTQAQLIQSEKMASLGELTAGIAHEIQNPLNFVNNFSEVSSELLEEMKEELDSGEIDEAKSLADDVIQNLEKITHHGKRADGIVKGMLQHSRTSEGKKEPTDLNALCDEFLRLSYHGLRAKDKSFNASFETDFDENLPKVEMVSQDIGRVILNLINNAFYSVNERKQTEGDNFQPIVKLSTKKESNHIVIKVEDNGTGIPQNKIDKIFQPFFTTKPTGKGTGLGLSLSYDIIKAHGGEIKVESEIGKGTKFTIHLLAKP